MTVTLIVLPRSSTLRTVNARVSVISLAVGFLSRHIPLGRDDMFMNLRFFGENPSSVKIGQKIH